MNHTVHNVIWGQVLDVRASTQEMTPAQIEMIHHYKTATYTIDGPLKMGAILAGASPKQIQAFEGYAIPVGKAFQLQDDILGLYGDAEKLGKPVGSDLQEGKHTLLIVKALELAPAADQAYIRKWLGNPRIRTPQIKKIRRIVDECGSLAHSNDCIDRMVADGIAALEGVRIRQEGRDFLLGLAHYVGKRDY